MTTQYKIPRRKPSAKNREFERLLRRAALYAKRRNQPDLAIARRKRTKAA